jgi:hypothetical protein
MAHDVFLSHSSKDKEVVDITCAFLEKEGIRCWMAPRNIRPGSSWGSAIVHAIRDARVMVLVFSTHANTSPQIKREVERAVHFNSTVIPMRVENIMPDDDLEYFLGTPHWLDAFTPPLEKHLDVLARAVKEILEPHPHANYKAAPPPLPRAPTVSLPPPIPRSPGSVRPLSFVPPPHISSSAKAPLVSPVVVPKPPMAETLRADPPDQPVTGSVLDAGTVNDKLSGVFKAIAETDAVGSFTTSLAATATTRIGVTIPEPFHAAGTPGRTLKLVPVEVLRGKPPLELYLTTADEFSFGRSAEADFITAFFPRNEKNDLRSRRLSKIHARIAYRDSGLWVHRKTGATVHIGPQPIGDDPAGYKLRERDQLILAEDFAVEIFYDISLQNTLEFINGEAWTVGPLQFNPTMLGAVRFEPLNSAPAIRNSCWLFIDVGFGSARGGVLTAGSEIAPQQGVILTIGGCFWILNMVDNEKVAIGDYRPAAREIVPLTQGDSVWLGAVRYGVEIA